MCEKYSIPQEIRDLMDLKFQNQFLEEMHMIFGIAIDMFSWNELFNYENTSGWSEAFLNTCRKTNKKEIIDYYRTLGWEQGDIFDDNLLDILIDSKLVLPGLYDDEVNRQLGIPLEKFDNCIHCGDYYLLEDMKQVVDDETGESCSCSECNNCLEVANVAPLKIDIFKAMKELINIEEKDIFYCEECGHYHLNKFKKENNKCLYCNINEESEYQSANNYYKNSIKENKKWLGVE